MDLRVDRLGNPLLDQFSEEGFVDCVFKIRDLRREKDHFAFQMLATYGGNTVGCAVRLVRFVKAGLSAEAEIVSEHVYAEGVQFLRTGEESDRLLSALATLYGLSKAPRRMREREPFTTIALHQGEIDIETQPVKLKLFGRDAESLPAEYNESFFNVDLVNGLIFWNEKDQEYRMPLVHSLSDAV
jgi:hypothetical protein